MKKKIISLLLAAMMLMGVLSTGAAVSADGVIYSDVTEDMWSYNDIVYVTENGLMNGTGGSTFSPAVSLTRAMVVTVLYRMEGSPRVTFRDLFLDVADRLYYSDAVIWAKTNNIITATSVTDWGEEYFSPDRTITRQELATMFVRFAGYKNIITENSATLDKFTDKADVATWAADAMKWATSCGLINGTGSGSTLSPAGQATREQFAAIIHRFDEIDFDYELVYSDPRTMSKYTEPEYPLVNDADIYVAVDGNDNNPGTLDKPLATFDAARLKVRELKKTAKDEIVVAFKAGNYGALDNVTFTAEDAGSEAVPIKYCKYGDGEVKFCNGVMIYESEFTLVEGAEAEMFVKNSRPYIYKADLSGRVDEFSFNTRLFTETGLAVEAREPNNRYISNMTTTVDPWASIQLQLALPGIVEKFSSIDGLKINGYLRTGWMNDTFDVLSYDPETQVMVLDLFNSQTDYWLTFPDVELMYEGRTDDMVFFSNLPEFIDLPNEYWFDKSTSTLYVYGAKGDYAIDGGGTFITVEEKAEYLSFVGLEFSATSASAIVNYADHFTVDLCKIGNVSGNAALDTHKSVKYYSVTNSEFYNCVEYCIYLYGTESINPDDPALPDSNHNVIRNNYFHDFTLPSYFSSAVRVGYDIGTDISHNYFYQGGHGGVWYGGCVGIRIEYNVFDSMMTKTEDFGSIYTGDTQKFNDNMIRHNIFMNGRVIGVYLDMGSSGQNIIGNIFYNNGVAIAQNGGQDNVINDNVFIFGQGAIGPAPLTYMSNNVTFDVSLYEDMSTAVGGNNRSYTRSDNPLFVNPSIGDYRIREGADFAKIPYEKIGRY